MPNRSGQRRHQVLVIGLGRFGTAVAETLTAFGHDVVGVDADPKLVQQAAQPTGPRDRGRHDRPRDAASARSRRVRPRGGRDREQHRGEHPHHRGARRPRCPAHLGQGDHRRARTHPRTGRRPPRRAPRARRRRADRPPRDRADDGVHRVRPRVRARGDPGPRRDRGPEPGRPRTAGALRGDHRVREAGRRHVHVRDRRHGRADPTTCSWRSASPTRWKRSPSCCDPRRYAPGGASVGDGGPVERDDRRLRRARRCGARAPSRYQSSEIISRNAVRLGYQTSNASS